MIVVAGLAGSGKTWVGQRLAAELGLPFLDKDTLTRPFVERVLVDEESSPNDRESDLYLREVRPLEYRCLEDTALENLEWGMSPVVAAPYVLEVRDARWYDDLCLEVEARKGRLEVVWVYSDPDALYERLVERGARRDEYKLGHWEEFIRAAEPDSKPVCSHTEIDNAKVPHRPVARQISELGEKLRS